MSVQIAVLLGAALIALAGVVIALYLTAPGTKEAREYRALERLGRDVDARRHERERQEGRR